MPTTATIRIPAPVHQILPRHEARFCPQYARLCTGKGGSMIAATNGKALACVPVQVEDGSGPVGGNVPMEALKALKRTRKEPAPALVLSADSMRVKDTTYAEPQGGFPPAGNVLPTVAAVNRGVVIGFNVELLAALAASLGAVDGMVTLIVDPGNKGAAVMLPHGAEGVGIVMPCSVNGGGEEGLESARADAIDRLTDARTIFADALPA